MVRFIIYTNIIIYLINFVNLHSNMVRFIINYICFEVARLLNLHSNMVRFIIFSENKGVSLFSIIYIPIWLDLLFGNVNSGIGNTYIFTFQYG